MLARNFYPNVSKNICRKAVSCSSSKRVFELHSNVPETKLEFVRDAYETCHHLDGVNKEACYLVFGMDSKNVETYLPIVEKFERIYNKKYVKYQDMFVCHLDPVEPPTIIKIGPFKFTIEKH